MASSNSFVTTNDEQFRAAIQKASDSLKDLRVPFNLIYLDFYRSEKAIFQLKGPGKYEPFKKSKGSYRAGESGGQSFVTDSESPYQKRKKAEVGFDYPLLVRSGRLAASLSGPGNPGNVTQVSPLTLVIGTTVPYGVYHQSDEPRSKMPLRKFVFIGPEAARFATDDQIGRLQRWLGYIDDYLERKLKLAEQQKAGL